MKCNLQQNIEVILKQYIWKYFDVPLFFVFYLLSLVCHFLFLSCAFNLQNPAVGQCYVVGQLLPLPLTLIMTTPGKEHFFVSHDPLILKFRFLFHSLQWCYFKTQHSFLCCLSALETFQAFIPSSSKSLAQICYLANTMCCRTQAQINAWGEALKLHELYSSTICYLIGSLLENLALPHWIWRCSQPCVVVVAGALFTAVVLADWHHFSGTG